MEDAEHMLRDYLQNRHKSWSLAMMSCSATVATVKSISPTSREGIRMVVG